MTEIDEGDIVGEEIPQDVRRHLFKRRNSISAGSYNPEEDNEGESVETFPKTDEQFEKLKQAVKNLLIFRCLDESQAQAVIEAMQPRSVSAGEVIIQQGEYGDFFYVIESGRYEVYIAENSCDEPVHKMTYDNFGNFGELALMYNVPRAATVKAVTDGVLWSLTRHTFRRLVLRSTYEKRQRFQVLIKRVSVLQALDNYEVMNVCDALVPVSFQAGSVIIQQGDEADGMYFVEEGEVKVTQVDDDGSGEEVELVRLGKGDYFGEMALVTKSYRSATVYAVSDVKLAFLDVAAFERLLGPCMDYIKKKIEDYAK